MRFIRLLIVTLLFGSVVMAGCSLPGGSRQKSASLDLADISSSISKTPPPAVELTGSGADSDPAEEDLPVVPVRDISTKIDGRNPFLKDIMAASPNFSSSSSAPGEGVLLNFDNADIYEVIQVISEILDVSYIIDPKVKGVVNIRSGKKIPMDQLGEVFKKILNINGLDIRSEGGYSYIFPTARPTAQKVFGGKEAQKLKDSPRMVIQVVPVLYLKSTEVVNLLKPYLSPQGTIQVLENLNTIFICDYESRVMDSMMILSRLDISPLASLKVRMVRVDKAPLYDLRDELTEILTALQVNKKGHNSVTVLALERVNSILIISNDQEMIDSTTRWITELDVVPREGRDNIYIYNVRNSVASDLAALVNELISDKDGQQGKRRPPAKTVSVPKRQAAGAMTGAARKPGAAPPSGQLQRPTAGAVTTSIEPESGLRFAGEPVLIADDGRNVILLRALPADYVRLLKLLERLDNMPRQVLIEVLVAEVKLSDSWELGIEWALQDKGRIKVNGGRYNGSYVNNTTIGNEPVPTDLTSAALGFTYSLLNNAEEAVGILNTIASNNDISILSSPQVMVLNNETATVNVGDQVPIVTTETINDSGSGDTRTVQYRDTGVILKVTPKINYDGIIILDIDQQVSSAVENDLSGISSPKISTRSLKTKLAVRDGQTVFMGGLIENNTTMVESGVPLLMDIPVLGWVFKYQREKNEKTELLVMITPYVIESEDVLAQYVEKFNKKVGEIRSKLLAGSGSEKRDNAADTD